MYHKIKVKLLSNPQISRLLNGHGVRVSDGNDHDIELSKEQLKKFMKAREKGKAITLNMDPFQMQAHQFLRGSGSGGSSGSGVSRRNKYTKWVDALGAKQVIDAGMSKGASTISGMGVSRRNKYTKWVDALGAKQVIDAGMSKGASTISGMGVSRRNKYTKWVDALGAKQVIDAGMSKGASTISGMGVSRRNKYTKWVDALGAKQVIDAGMSRGASTISGMGTMRDIYQRASMPDARKASSKYGPNFGKNAAAQDDSEYDGPLYLGLGLKRRTPKKKSMRGSALMPAGY